jgi:hypothetical protein
MHPPLELLNVCPVFGNVEHLFDATIPPDEARIGSYSHDPSWAASRANCKRSLFASTCSRSIVERIWAMTITK